MDGWKFLETARRRFPGMQTPVVLLSAVHNLRDQAMRLGVTAFLPKPFDLQQVTRMAHELGHHAHEEPRHSA